MSDIFLWLFIFGWDPGEAMANAFGKVIVITEVTNVNLKVYLDSFTSCSYVKVL